MWNASPAGADTVVAQAAPAPSPSPTASPPPHLLQVSGYADAGYTSASIASGVGTAGDINGRVFDNLNQQIQFHNFNLQVAYNGPIGGKVEASFGDDANIINAYPESQLSGLTPSLVGGSLATGPEIDLTQAYLQVISGQFTGIVGKFETLAGAEVIESPSDMNFSRSILFGYAVPFTHTGGRLTWAMNSNISFVAGLNKGWGVTKQLNFPQNGSFENFANPTPITYNDSGALTVELGALWNPSKAFSAVLDGYTGQVEQGYAVAFPIYNANPARPTKSLIDSTVTWHATSAWTFALNGDYGTQTNTNLITPTAFSNPAGGTTFGYGTARWGGAAGYASYAINSQWTASLRGEVYEDFGGATTGITQTWTEGTGTLAYAPNSNVILRAEIRGDHSNQLYFIGPTVGGAPTFYKSNAQFGLEAIVKWP
jgi:hypothetical protein